MIHPAATLSQVQQREGKPQVVHGWLVGGADRGADLLKWKVVTALPKDNVMTKGEIQ